MITALVLCVLAAASEPLESERVRDLDLYAVARAAAGHNPDAHVNLALWCEARGLSAERIRHLALAVIHNPNHTVARGLLGMVAYRGKWQCGESLADSVGKDPSLASLRAAYLSRRARAPWTADGQRKLATWCDENGLKEQAVAHWTAVLRLDPKREVAWKRLGYSRRDGLWMTDAEFADRKAERVAQELADRTWKPRLTKFKAALSKANERAEAEAALFSISDPRAVPAVCQVFAAGNTLDQGKAVDILGRIDGQAASRAIAVLALSAGTPGVRTKAIETLRLRDPRDYFGGLVGMLRDPIKFAAVPVGATGYGSSGFVAVEGKDAVYQTTFSIDEGLMDFQDIRSFNHLQIKLRSLIANSITYEDRAAVVNERIASVVVPLQQASATINDANARVTSVMHLVTGQDLGSNPESWKAWWADHQGYVYDGTDPNAAEAEGREPPSDQLPKPYKRIPPFVRPKRKPIISTWVHYSCFGAGTPVIGIDGRRPIEDVRVGDVVLTQDAKTGLLSFQPVVAVYHNPPSETLRLDLDGEPLVTTGIHRFWKPGQGWVMARDLKPGDRVRTVGGLATVKDVREHFQQPVFNLEVASGGSFFVGKAGALVHDNSLVRPVGHPFDASTETVTLTR